MLINGKTMHLKMVLKMTNRYSQSREEKDILLGRGTEAEIRQTF